MMKVLSSTWFLVQLYPLFDYICIQSTFKLVLWYVRLRRASKGVFCPELLEVEKRAGPLAVIKNPVKNVLLKNLKDYLPLYTNGEEDDESKDKKETEQDDSDNDFEEEVADYI